MNDLISRQAAIDAVAFGITYAKAFDLKTGEAKNLFEKENEALAKAVERIKELPSAQPDEEKIDKFAAYIYHAFKDFYRIGLHRKTLTPEQCRRVARNVLAEVPSAQPETHDKRTGTHACDLPSAQPERQKGEWIDYTEDGYVECPFCHNATNCDGNKDELHFCFSCGADMREVIE